MIQSVPNFYIGLDKDYNFHNSGYSVFVYGTGQVAYYYLPVKSSIHSFHGL